MKNTWRSGIAILVVVSLTFFVSCEKDEFTFDAPNMENSEFMLKSELNPIAPLEYCGEIKTFNLIAGQTIDAGDIQILNTRENLYVVYQAKDGWMLKAVHVFAGNKADMPVNKAGNPQLGLFPLNISFDEPTQTYVAVFDLANLEECYIVAAHADVVKIIDDMEVDSQTAWGEGTRITLKGNWGMIMNYCTQKCEDNEPDKCFSDETAWADGLPYNTQGNWALYTPYTGEETVLLIAGQHLEAGTVHFSEVVDGKVTITVTLATNWSLQPTGNLKVQGYMTAPSGNPSPGQFDNKTNYLTITVDEAAFYGVHVDVRLEEECQ